MVCLHFLGNATKSILLFEYQSFAFLKGDWHIDCHVNHSNFGTAVRPQCRRNQFTSFRFAHARCYSDAGGSRFTWCRLNQRHSLGGKGIMFIESPNSSAWSLQLG